MESEEVATVSMEPKPTPEEDVKTRRLEVIKAKALEIEKVRLIHETTVYSHGFLLFMS